MPDRLGSPAQGSVVNQDGRSSSLTAPNGPSQRELILATLHVAELDPERLAGIAVHGTGTPLGDPIGISRPHSSSWQMQFQSMIISWFSARSVHLVLCWTPASCWARLFTSQYSPVFVSFVEFARHSGRACACYSIMLAHFVPAESFS